MIGVYSGRINTRSVEGENSGAQQCFYGELIPIPKKYSTASLSKRPNPGNWTPKNRDETTIQRDHSATRMRMRQGKPGMKS